MGKLLRRLWLQKCIRHLGLGLSVSSLSKAELCFAIAQIIALDEDEFVNGFLDKDPKKARKPRKPKASSSSAGPSGL